MTVGDFILKIQEEGLEGFGLFYSSYEAIVTDNKDSENRGRLRVKCPAVYGDAESDWAMSTGMFSGKKIGFFALPQVGDPVWLSFRRGDIKIPLWSYGCLATDYRPEGADFEHFTLQTPKGYKLIFDEADEKIILKKTDKDYICIKDKISIYANGENLFTQMDKLLDALLIPQNIQTIIGPGQFNPDTVTKITEVKTAIGKLLE